jgi:hypothetical protein
VRVFMMFTGIAEAGSLRGFAVLDQPRLALADTPANAKKPRHQALPGQEENRMERPDSRVGLGF